MKFVSIRIRAVIRPMLLAALLLALAGAGFSRWGSGFWLETTSAQGTVGVFNAASFANDANRAVPPDTIGAAFGSFVTQNNQSYTATSVPLPTTLGGVSVKINGVTTSLFFVGPTQINLLVPSSIVDGTATIVVTNSDNTTRTGTFPVARSAPGLFSARANGQGVAAALTTTDGITYINVANPDLTEKDLVAGTKQQPNILVLFGTGLRNTPAANPTDGNGVAEAITVRIQGVPANVQYAGASPDFAGLDQMNVIIPPELSGLGSVRIRVTAGGRTSNEVTIKLAGELPPIVVTEITAGQTIDGQLTADDQVQAGSEGNTYFFDAYRFETTVANTTVAVDLRSTQFDAGVLLYRQDGTSLTLVAADDQTGQYGNGTPENNNALLLTVLPTAGRYVVFASSSDFEPNGVGAYTLKVTSNIAQQLTYGQVVSNAAIATTDLQTAAGTYLDVYWFNGLKDENARINMNSVAFDSFLILQRNDGDPPLTSDDNSGGGLNAQLTRLLPATGIYIILATPYARGTTGAYTISLNKVTNLAGQAEISGFDLFNIPSREIRDQRPATATGPIESAFERAGRRRIVINRQD